MNAVVVRSPGDAEELRAAPVPVPRPGNRQVLVRVQAALIGPTDIGIRSGSIPAVLPLVIGSDVSGDVVLVGPGVTDCSPGDRVLVLSDSIGRISHGGYADYLVVPSADLHPIPENVSYLSSAAVGRPFSTAWTALFRDGRMGINERVAIVGAADPVGIAAVQICRWKKNPVIAVSNGRHAQRLQAIGATRVVSQSAPNLPDHVKAGLGHRDASLVVNVLGEALAASLEMLDVQGRLVVTTGGVPQMLDTHRLIELQAQIVGSTGGTDATDVSHIHKLLSEATFLPVIDSIYPLSQVGQAHRRAESEDTFGAVLLIPDHLYRSAK
jgi:NADPH:quinone reductase-like Zn-dependent oxidoreductase